MKAIFPVLLWCVPIGLFAFQPPDFELSQQVLPENEDFLYLIGQLSATNVSETDDLRYTLRPVNEYPENHFFRVRGDSLLSYYSFDYETQSAYTIAIEATRLSTNERQVLLFDIQVEDRVGKWDADGYADAEVAAKYPQVNEGDYIIFNQTANGEIYKNAEDFAGLKYPNKILIKGGKYNLLHLRFSGMRGHSALHRIAVTNFLGQVRARVARLYEGKYWRFTGQYDAREGTGSPFFTGCDQNGSSVDFGFSRGRFGIWISNEWRSENGLSNLSVDDRATHFEMDHLEVSDGGFAGVLIKDDHGSQDMDQVYLHHLYIHDIGSEGIYLGSTQPDPQHMFHDLIIENCVVVRTGSEALQAEQLGAGSLIRNNVLWGALDWIDPFQRYHDNTLQFSAREGGVTVENNILLGGGEKFFNVSNKPLTDPDRSLDPIVIRNNLAWGCHGPIGVYQFKNTDGVTPWIWEGNYFGRFLHNYDWVYPGHLANTRQVFAIASEGVDVLISGNTFDQTAGALGGNFQQSSARIEEKNNQVKSVEEPWFVQALGTAGAVGYLRWMRWTTHIGTSEGFPAFGTNKGQPFTFHPGDIVQYWLNGESRFYVCIQQNTGVEPGPDQTDYWTMLTWENEGSVSYYPPDDFRLYDFSPYQSLGMGIQDHVKPCYTPVGLQGLGPSPVETHESLRFQPCRDRGHVAQPEVSNSMKVGQRIASNEGGVVAGVYPNPATTECWVEVSLPYGQPVSVYLVSSVSKVREEVVRDSFYPKGKSTIKLPVNRLRSGVFRVLVITAQARFDLPVFVLNAP